ncbi:MAG: hypothetical protein MI919_23870 [Holophagales bacterium]|nr:hypothetical protein [Holophagales bacterium]
MSETDSGADTNRAIHLVRRLVACWLVVLLLAFTAGPVTAIVLDLTLVEMIHEAAAEHASQQQFYDLVASGFHEEAFVLAFELGDELFEATFNALDGVGANVGDGQRFTRVPRADLAGGTEWADHFPARATGPNAQACNSCHNQPFDDGAGPASGNVHRDPLHSASLGSFIQRNTPHVFGMAGPQLLAEEMTARLHRLRDEAVDEACATGQPASRRLKAKGVSYGRITATPVSPDPCEASLDTAEVEGVSPDLIIRPFQWKGSELSVRAFNRGASHNELGMQSVELVGAGVDGDFDNVVDELTVGDQTALAIYLAAQPRPTSTVELAALGLIDPLTPSELFSIVKGRATFSSVGCDSCHRPSLKVSQPIYTEPSQRATHRDALFPAGQDPVSEGVDPAFPVSFDITRDQPDNRIEGPFGQIIRLGSFQRDHHGRAIVRLYGDLKLHDMGPGLAESIDETGSGASVWMTKELWGVGSTAPYLHDGRATTLTEAILEHGGAAAPSRQAFEGLSATRQADLIAFLESLVLFKIEEEE